MENLLPKFIEDLNHTLKMSNLKSRDIIMTYYHLFEILNLTAPDSLNYMYECWLEEADWTKEDESEKGMWFFSFHKGMRQGDLYVNTNIDVKRPHNLTKEELERHSVLVDMIHDAGREDNLPELTGDEYTIAYAHWRVKHKAILTEHAELQKRKLNQSRESIGGHLDMVLWNLIHVDTNNVLYKALESFFEDVRMNFIKF